jgi:putative transposase
MVASMRRQQRSRAQWQSLIERAKRSPLSTAAFCRGEGVSTASFYAWRKRIGNSAPQSAAVTGCAPVPARSAATVAAALPGEAAGFLDLGTLANAPREAACWDLELALGTGVVLRLRRG